MIWTDLLLNLETRFSPRIFRDMMRTRRRRNKFLRLEFGQFLFSCFSFHMFIILSLNQFMFSSICGMIFFRILGWFIFMVMGELWILNYHEINLIFKPCISLRVDYILLWFHVYDYMVICLDWQPFMVWLIAKLI